MRAIRVGPNQSAWMTITRALENVGASLAVGSGLRSAETPVLLHANARVHRSVSIVPAPRVAGVARALSHG